MTGREWEAKIAQRLDDLKASMAQTIDADEVIHRIDARLRRR